MTPSIHARNQDRGLESYCDCHITGNQYEPCYCIYIPILDNSHVEPRPVYNLWHHWFQYS